jgi:membrane protein
VSWLAVLLGAQLAASHQQEPAARQNFQARHADQAFRESLAIAVAAQAARDFVDGCVRCTSAALADVLEVPTPVLDDVLEALIRAEVLARAVSEGAVAYLPARDIDSLRLEDVRDAVRRDPSSATLRHTIDQQLGERLRRLLDDLERQRRNAPENLTLRELARLVQPRPRTDAPAAVLDPKQPEVPA